MTDRELLELAAKAYWGDEIDDVCSIRWLEEDQTIGYTHGDNQDHNGVDREFVWGPLTDDGDALRLAVRCCIVVEYRREVPACFAYHYALKLEVIQRNDELDPYAATRRAIVKAAAEIGRNMT